MTRSLLLVCLLTCAWVSTAQADSEWLLGTWWYADADGEIFEGDEKDGMRFGDDGTVDLIDGSGNAYVTCRYTLGDRLRLDCEIRGKTRQMTFRIAGNRTRLANVEDEEEGYYRRDD